VLRIVRFAALLGLLVIALVQLPAQAQAKIVVGQGALGIHLGDSEGRVRSTLGQPFRTEPTFWAYTKPCLCTVNFKRGDVTAIDTLSKSQRTSKGIGPGSSYDKTVAAYPEANCYHPDVYGDNSRFCVVPSTYKGRTVETIFAFFEQDLPLRDVEIRWR
jgi:hypothetical protein